MEQKQDTFEGFLDNIRDYITARQQLLRLQVTEKVSGILSNFFSLLIIIPFFLLAFLFLSITLAHVFSELWGHEYAGYLTVTLLYVLIGILMVKYRKGLLVKPIKNKLIKQFLSK